MGNFLITAGDFLGVSKTSACRIVRRVSMAIASLCPQYVKMYETNEEMQRAAQAFYMLASFPRVIGAIDCTLIPIDSIGGRDAEIYRCRKGYFALNVQTVCDAQLKIRNIVARWRNFSSFYFFFTCVSHRKKRDLFLGSPCGVVFVCPSTKSDKTASNQRQQKFTHQRLQITHKNLG